MKNPILKKTFSNDSAFDKSDTPVINFRKSKN